MNEKQKYIEIEKFIKELNENPESTFDKIMAMEDEVFEEISGTLLQELIRTFKSTEAKLALSQTLSLNGITIKDFTEELLKAMSEVQQLGISDKKKEFFTLYITILCNELNNFDIDQKKIVTIPIELCQKDAKIPTYAHDFDAGADIYCVEDIDLAPGERKIIPTGFKVACPTGYAILIQPRSGLSAKTSLRITNSPGLIDAGYRDEVGVIVENTASKIKDIDYDFDDNGKPIISAIWYGETVHLEKGQRIAQMRIVEVPPVLFTQVDDINDIEGNRNGGFGSTDNK